MALAVQLVIDVNYLLWIPLIGFVLVWMVIWRVFTTLETVFGLMGLAMIVVVVAVVQLHPSWSQLFHHAPTRSFRRAKAIPPTSTTPSPCSVRR